MMKPSALDRIHVREEDPKEMFEIIESVGVGNFGVVLKARNRVTGDIVAIKQVPLSDTDKEDLDIIVKEVEILQECDHPNIVRFYGTYQSMGVLWIVMEYCEGGSVDMAYDQLRRPLSEPLIAYVCRQALLGLLYLHERHVIHRDIKGSNLLLTKGGQVKLADFGVSTVLKHTLSRRNSFIGTALWMAPEALAEKDYDSRADIWSLGITTIELAEGQPPHLGMHIARAVFFIPLNDPPTLQAKERWSPQMHMFVRRLLTKDKELRPSAAIMLMDPFVSPGAVAPQEDMAAVVEQLLARRRSIGEGQDGSDGDSNASAMTIVTRAPSVVGVDEGAGEEGGEGAAAIPTDEAAAQWIDEHVSPRRRASPATGQAAARAGGRAAGAGTATGGRGAPLGGRLVLLPLLHLEDMSFDALSGCGRTLLCGSTASTAGIDSVGGAATSSVGLFGAGTAGGATLSSGGVASGVWGGGSRVGVPGATQTTLDGIYMGESNNNTSMMASVNRYYHSSFLMPTSAGGGAAPVTSPYPPVYGPPFHEGRLATAAAHGDALAETAHLLGCNVEAFSSQFLRLFETTTLRTVQEVFLFHQYLPYTRAVSEAEAKHAQRMRLLCGTVLKNVYAATCESARNA
ncbi:protein kinase, putative [Leishmania panamensis]|uniref:non-specific serine/threonine protein kinase n=1 Tax=Leishmania panamensis TaxID=5679 RepID=A0A088RM35_LEIPA|nr:protein kinase, putative [Leishmania panamensis]AIN96905.1 protein kinase, putative [Leishmania panamensis]